tara:strand:- start:9877 stop:10092 length:216 start_codon:yes stop_codon:yes gene_type:complete
MAVLVNYSLNPGVDYYIEFKSVFSSLRFFIEHKKDFYFYTLFLERENNTLKVKSLKCDFKNVKKKEIALKP